MSVEVTFITDENGKVTATINTPYTALQSPPVTIDRTKGTVDSFSPLQDPNEPHSFKFNLGSLSGWQLTALANAASKKGNDPISKALLQAIAQEQRRRREEEEKKKKKSSADGKRPLP